MSKLKPGTTRMAYLYDKKEARRLVDAHYRVEEVRKRVVPETVKEKHQ